MKYYYPIWILHQLSGKICSEAMSGNSDEVMGTVTEKHKLTFIIDKPTGITF